MARSLKVLVVGSGAREHALAWKFASVRDGRELICAPGNPGTAAIARSVPVDLGRPEAVLELAEAEAVDLTVIGPEAPLAAGVADLFAARGRVLVGPTRAAAELEWSKVAAKQFMTRYGIPTARYRVCATWADAMAVVARGELGWPLVVKADGLAAGKGVIVAENRAAAETAVRRLMVDRVFGDAGARVVLEECLCGEETSFFALSDGRRAMEMPTAQDHKRAFDGDQGPNTGGMGAVAPSPLVTPEIAARVMDEIIEPTLGGLRAEGRPYRGFLYVGLMLTAEGPRVLEFNARLGDPETQVILPLLDEDLLPLVEAAALGRLDDRPARRRSGAAVGVVLASGGYPERFETGYEIAGLEAAEQLADVLVFHAGTTRRDGRLVTAGGRVLTVVGCGADYPTAMRRAYDGVSQIRFERMQYRRDIGRTATKLREG
jgi:phosphoribosylamine--glycine ligase